MHNLSALLLLLRRPSRRKGQIKARKVRQPLIISLVIKEHDDDGNDTVANSLLLLNLDY